MSRPQDAAPAAPEHEAVHLVGELDLATAPRAAARLYTALASGHAVVVDLRPLSFLDVAGLHVILGAAEEARRSATRFVVVRGTAEVDMVFSLTSTEDQLELVRLDAAQHCACALGPKGLDVPAPLPRRSAREQLAAEPFVERRGAASRRADAVEAQLRVHLRGCGAERTAE